MFLFNFIKRKILDAKVPIESMIAIIHSADADNDGYISVREVINGVKVLMDK